MDLNELTERCLERARENLLQYDMNDDEAMEMIIRVFFEEEEARDIPMDEADLMIRRIFFKTRGKLGILDPLVSDEDVNEIMVNGKDDIFYEKNGEVKRYEMTFDTTEELEEVIRNIAAGVNREINEMNPIVDARLEDGSRINGVYKNVAVNGPILTIRKFSDRFMDMEDLVGNGTLTEEESEFLKALVACGYNLFISGGTSSGKTTLLNALSAAVPEKERVIVIEDSMELKLRHIENIVHMECRNANSSGKGMITMADLIKAGHEYRPSGFHVHRSRQLSTGNAQKA